MQAKEGEVSCGALFDQKRVNFLTFKKIGVPAGGSLFFEPFVEVLFLCCIWDVERAGAGEGNKSMVVNAVVWLLDANFGLTVYTRYVVRAIGPNARNQS